MSGLLGSVKEAMNELGRQAHQVGHDTQVFGHLILPQAVTALHPLALFGILCQTLDTTLQVGV